MAWSQISAAKTIVECQMSDIKVEPSQGTHFFQNIVSFNVGYLTASGKEDYVDWSWLDKLDAELDDGSIRHCKLEKPLRVLLDSKDGEALILKK